MNEKFSVPLAIFNEANKILVKFDGQIWTFYEQRGGKPERKRVMSSGVLESPVYLLWLLDEIGDGEELLHRIAREWPTIGFAIDEFLSDREILGNRIVLFEESGSGILDSWDDIVSMYGDEKVGFSVEGSTKCDWEGDCDEDRNAFGEVVIKMTIGVFDAHQFVVAVDEVLSEDPDRWEVAGCSWNRLIQPLKNSGVAFADEVQGILMRRGTLE